MLLRCPQHGLNTLPFSARASSTGSPSWAGVVRRGRVCRKQQLRPHASAADVASTEAGARCWLEPAEDGNYDVVCVTEGPTFIGAAESDFGFSEAKVTTRHVQLSMPGNTLRVKDLFSTNGTKVGGQALLPFTTTDVKDGEVIELADGKRYTVRYAGDGLDEGASASPRRHHAQKVKGPAQQEGAGGVGGAAWEYGHKALSLGILYYANRALANACAAASIKFPSPLIGMFAIIATLLVLDRVSKRSAERVLGFFGPALNWIQRWLPLFYVPTLVVLPLAIRGIPGADLAKILGIIAVGMPASLLVTAQVTVLIRNAVRTEMEEQPPVKRLPPFTAAHYAGWGAVLAASLLAAVISPEVWGARAVTPFLLGSTVMGYLAGIALPQSVQGVLHPLVSCAVLGNVGAAVMGAVTRAGHYAMLEAYITKGTGAAWGAGDWLMSFLGVVILSFGFKIFGQRRLMRRHAPEIFGATFISAAFSLFATAFAAHAIGLAPGLARALVPRSITVALALPIAAQLSAPAPIVAAGVCLTGLLGANFAQALLNRFGFKDPIARGLATAGSAHGLGTAALARNEPEALPFCALAYALIGIISTLLVSLPPVAAALMAITA